MEAVSIPGTFKEHSLSLSLAAASAHQSCSSDAGKSHSQRRRVGLDKDSPSLRSHRLLQWHGIVKLFTFKNYKLGIQTGFQ